MNDDGGDIKVTGGNIEMKADARDIALYSEADLANTSSAILSFNITGQNLNNEDVFLLEVSIDGGVNYTPMASYTESDPSNFSENIFFINIFGSLSSNTRIEFRQLGGGGAEKFKFDNVEIRYQKSDCSGSCIPVPLYPPVAVNDTMSTGINTSILIDVDANDSDPSGDGLTTTLGAL